MQAVKGLAHRDCNQYILCISTWIPCNSFTHLKKSIYLFTNNAANNVEKKNISSAVVFLYRVSAGRIVFTLHARNFPSLTFCFQHSHSKSLPTCTILFFSGIFGASSWARTELGKAGRRSRRLSELQVLHLKWNMADIFAVEINAAQFVCSLRSFYFHVCFCFCWLTY